MDERKDLLVGLVPKRLSRDHAPSSTVFCIQYGNSSTNAKCSPFRYSSPPKSAPEPSIIEAATMLPPNLFLHRP